MSLHHWEIERGKKSELELGETCQTEMPLAELFKTHIIPHLAPGRVRIQVQLTEVGRGRGDRRFTY